MNVVFLALLAGLVCGFAYLGVRTGIPAIRRAQSPGAGLARLAASAIALTLAALAVGVGAMLNTDVAGVMNAIPLALLALAVAAFIFKQRFDRRAQATDGLRSAACFLAAAMFPLAWYNFPESLMAWFFGLLA